MLEDRFDTIHVGDEAEILHVITTKDVDTFAELTGDDNPLHVDDDYASGTTFKKKVVHGMLTASFISTVVGTKIPGPGSLWYEQQIRFLAPVRIGSQIRVWVKVTHKSLSQRIIVLETVVYDEQERRVIEGEAKIKVLEQEKKKEVLMSENNNGAIIISGAAKGIGASIARSLAADGFSVVINYNQSKDSADLLTKEIKESGGNAIAFKADVSERSDVAQMVKSTLTSFGKISGIVNNACPPIHTKSFLDFSWNDIKLHLDIQLKGAFNLTQLVIPHLIESGGGVVVNIGSIVVDNTPTAEWLPYNVAKSAIVNFTKSIANDYGPKGIRANCVSPGMTGTDLIADIPEKAKMLTKMQTPLRKLATPDDIAGTVSFLFSNKSLFITGQNIRVCGGIVMS